MPLIAWLVVAATVVFVVYLLAFEGR